MDVQVFGQDELVQWISDGLEVQSHLISIGNPKTLFRTSIESYFPPVFRKTFKSILRIRFYDVIDKEQLDSIRFNKRIPKKKDVLKVIRYFRKTRHLADGYTIHCWQGVSRSSAIALGILYMIHRDEQKAAEELIRIRPIARPNERIVKWFDEILGSDLIHQNEQINNALY